MSDPILTAENPIQGALCELISGMSSLNMGPEPKEHLPEEFYLSQVDAMAAHAMEHLRAAFELLRRAEQERERWQNKIFRLEVKIAKLANKGEK